MQAVMYVDDEGALRRVVQRWFQKRGVTILVAESAAEARRLLREHDVAGVFIDVWLGEETGFDLFAWITEYKPQLKSRVVFITGDVRPSVPGRAELQTLGCPMIGKPFDLGDLELFVTQWTHGEAAAEASHDISAPSPRS